MNSFESLVDVAITLDFFRFETGGVGFYKNRSLRYSFPLEAFK